MKDKSLAIIAVIGIIAVIIFYKGNFMSLLGYDDYSPYDKQVQTGVIEWESKDKCLFTFCCNQGEERCNIPHYAYCGSSQDYGCLQYQSKTDKWLLTGSLGDKDWGTDSSSSMQYKNGKVRLTTNAHSKSSTLETLKLSKGYNVKISLSGVLACGSFVWGSPATSYPYSTSVGVILNGVTIYSQGSQGNCGTAPNIDKDIEIYSFITTDNVEVKVTGQEAKLIDLSGQNNMTLKFVMSGGHGGYVDIDLRVKTPESCTIDENSVLVFDEFSSAFSKEDLIYAPLSFCPSASTLPTIRRVSTNHIIPDEKGEIFQKITKGETVDKVFVEGQYYSLSTDTTILFPYITKYVEGMPHSCNIGYAVNTRTKTCEQIVEQETPTEVVLQCSAATDCWLPSNCEGITATCTNSKCVYSQPTCNGIEVEKIVVNEKLVYLEVIKNIEKEEYVPIYIGETNFMKTFDKNDGSMQFGDLEITSQRPSFECSSYTYDYNKDSCYKIYVGGKIVNYAEKFSLNDYLDGVCYGKRVNADLEFENDNWQTSCIFTIKKDLLSVSFSNNSKFYDLNANAQYKVNVGTPYTFNNAGFFIDCYSKVGGVQRSIDLTEQKVGFSKSNSVYYINLNTSEYGTYDCYATPYIRVFGDKWFTFKDSPKLSFSYNVGEEKPIENTSTQPPTEPVKAKMNWLKIGIIILIVFIILWWMKKR